MRIKLSQLNLLDNYRNWRQGTGVFEGFCRATPFVSLQHYPDMELHLSRPEPPANLGQLEAFAARYASRETLLVLDLPGELGVRSAYSLQTRLAIKPVLLFNNPLHQHGLVGGRDFINTLLAGGENLTPLDQPRGFAFILDYDRYSDYPDSAYQEFFNNQYELTDEDLPELELLNFCGINRLVVLSNQPLKEDLQNYLKYLQEQGLEVLIECCWEGK
ncbi:MAG: hypothetical protein WA118_09090 [Carboxydocellales bacterium]